MEKVGAPSWNSWEIGNWGDPTSTFSFPSSSPTSLYADQAVPFHGGSGGTHVAGGAYHHSHSLTCLRLGKRQYYGEHGVTKRERPSSTGPVPRCQVEGCEKLLGGAKEYHRRHKVCEVHSKAPWVVVLGTEQRFCQQCSRFHALTEFDDAKRSCRRRLAGHNERRRKSSIGTSDMNVSSSLAMGSGFPLSSPDCVLSLLSSTASPWVPASDLSSRSSAALSELIAENRAALLARQLFVDHGAWPVVGTGNVVSFSCMPHEHQVESQAAAQLTNGWRQFNDAETNLTLDLLQIPGSSFDILPGKRKSNEEEMCCTILKSLQGAHMV